MPKSGYVFPYGISLGVGGRMSVFPAAEVLFPRADGEHITFIMLIDSGATVSALPKFDAETLGIKAEKGTPSMVAGINGEPMQGWQHEVSIILEGDEYTLPVMFLDNDNAPRILGREGIFELFTVVFEEEKRKTALVKNKSKEQGAIREIIDSVSQR